MEFVQGDEELDVLRFHQDNTNHLDFDLELVSPGSLQLAEAQLEPVTDISFLSPVVMNPDSCDGVHQGGTSERLLRCVVPTHVQVAHVQRGDTSIGRMSIDRVEETEVALAVPRTYYSKVDCTLTSKANAEERSKPRFQTWAQFIWTTGMQEVSQLSKTSSKGMIPF
jgi:hypothetical protein